MNILCWTLLTTDELDEEWTDIEKMPEGPDDTTRIGRRRDFEHKLLELTGFISWCWIAPEILGRSYSEDVGMDWDHVRGLVRTCGAVDWRKNGTYAGRTEMVGGKFIAEDMARLLPPYIAASEQI